MNRQATLPSETWQGIISLLFLYLEINKGSDSRSNDMISINIYIKYIHLAKGYGCWRDNTRRNL